VLHGFALPSAASATTTVFRTPAGAAYCGIGEAGFYCWTPNDGFVVLMDGPGRPVYSYGADYRDRRPHAHTLRFGQRWHDGYVRCTSRRNGLTCRNRDHHGLWLGRYVGYRVW